MARRPYARFSGDPRIRVFDAIAWIYGLLFRIQRLGIRRSLGSILRRLGLPPQARILDIGCGTGAYLSVLAEMGYAVQAVDASPRMVATARRLLRWTGLDGRPVGVSVGNPLEGLAFPDRAFDLVLAAHVVHGMPPGERRRFYREAGRLSRNLVVLHDFSPRSAQGPRFVTRVLEVLERSDYRRFRRSGLQELQGSFAEVEVITTPSGSAWYLCRSPL